MRIVHGLAGLTLVFGLGCGNQAAGSGDAPGASSGATSAKPAMTATATATATTPPPSDADGCVIAVTGKTVESLGKKEVEFTLTNKTKVDVKFCQMTMYAYGKGDKIVGWRDQSINYMQPLAAGSTRTNSIYVEESKGTKSLAGEPDVTFEGVITKIEYVDGKKWEDSSLTAPGRPKGGKR